MSFFRKIFSSGKADGTHAAVGVPSALPTVQSDHQALSPTLREWLASEITGLVTVPASAVQQIVQRAELSVQTGDLASLEHALRDIDGLESKATVAALTGLVRGAVARADRERQMDMGIKKAVWLYSGAPCMPNPKHPSEEDLRRDAAHRNANGATYSLAKGMLVDGRWAWPGCESGCKCVSRPVLPI